MGILTVAHFEDLYRLRPIAKIAGKKQSYSNLGLLLVNRYAEKKLYVNLGR